MSAVYTAVATATGEGRNGPTRTDHGLTDPALAAPGGGRTGAPRPDDGLIALDLAVPKEMGGPGGGANPEQLFAAGYAACFHGALKVVARQHEATFTDSAVTAEVGIGPNDAGGF